MEDVIKRLREERAAREESRIKKLKEMNLKKYSKNESQPSTSAKAPAVKASTSQVKVLKNNQAVGNKVKSSSHVNCSDKKPPPVVVIPKADYSYVKSKVITQFGAKNAAPKSSTQKEETKFSKAISKPDIIASKTKIANDAKNSKSTVSINSKDKPSTSSVNNTSKPDIVSCTVDFDKLDNKKVLTDITTEKTINAKLFSSENHKSRKSLAIPTITKKPTTDTRKSMLPRLESKSESVFERLYKPKYINDKITDKAVSNKPDYLKKAVKNSNRGYDAALSFILGKPPNEMKCPRRSISAVHFKRISKSEASNCIRKWGSVSDNLQKEKNEDDCITEDKVVFAVKSERKKVQFMTPSFNNLNTPRPDELQARLKSWLQKRGKSLSSYHHLQCFGLHNIKTSLDSPRSTQYEDALQSPSHFDEENKENIALESDSDDGSISELMGKEDNAVSGKEIDTVNWRDVSMASESMYNDSYRSHCLNDTTLTPAESLANAEELLQGALNDLSTLLREGFDWQQAARWLRSIRARFPHASKTAAYWECRAALEDARGDFAESVECWRKAIYQGTEESVADSNLELLLTKFMALEINPHSKNSQPANPKLVDVKNVFKSTIIRFAVQQAKICKSNPPTPKALATVTPVRRSSRLSGRVSRAPLVCDTVRQAATLAPQHVFATNDYILHTP